MKFIILAIFDLTIVPLPLIFRPDLDTAGFWSAGRAASSFSTLNHITAFTIFTFTVFTKNILLKNDSNEEQLRTDISVLSS